MVFRLAPVFSEHRLSDKLSIIIHKSRNQTVLWVFAGNFMGVCLSAMQSHTQECPISVFSTDYNRERYQNCEFSLMKPVWHAARPGNIWK